MTVFIAGYYGFENTGDEAILSAMIGSFSRRQRGAEFIVTSANPALTEALHNVRAVRFDDVYGVYEAIRECSLVVIGGGGLFQDYWGVDPGVLFTRRHWGINCYAGPSLLAALLTRPVVLYAVGVGPLQTQQAQLLTRVACETATAITVRDESSRNVLASLGVSTDRISVTADPAFSLELDSVSRALTAEPAQTRRPVLAVCIRHWDVGVHPAFWEQEVAIALDRFIAAEKGSVLFIPFSDLDSGQANDAVVSQRVLANMQRREAASVMDGSLSPMERCQYFARVDVTLCMRLHSLIFSALNRTPAVALSYDSKVDSQAAQIGGVQVLDIRSFDATTLAQALSAALAGAANFRGAIESRIESLKLLADSNAEIAIQAFVRRQQLPENRVSDSAAPVLAWGLQALLRENRDAISSLEQVSDRLSDVERDREESLKYLKDENSALNRRISAVEQLLSESNRHSEALQQEVARAGQFHQSQLAGFREIEAEHARGREFLIQESLTVAARLAHTESRLNAVQIHADAMGEELKQAARFQESQIEHFRAAEDERSRHAEFLRQENLALSNRLAESEDRLNGATVHAKAIHEELEQAARFQKSQANDFHTAEQDYQRQLHAAKAHIEAMRQQLTEADADNRALKARFELASRQIEERDARLGALQAERDSLHATMQQVRQTYESVLQGIEVYWSRFQRELDIYRSQRAWKAMLHLRRLYAFLARNVAQGRFSFTGVSDQELRFPKLTEYLPPAFVWPAENSAPTSTAPPAASRPPVYDVIILAIIDFDFRYQRPQQIAAQFARNGHKVYWVSPTRFLAPVSTAAYETVTLRENLQELHLRGTQPDIYLGQLTPAAAEELSASLAKFCQDNSISEHALIVQLPFWRQVALQLRNSFGSRIVYDCMDDWETFENMGKFNVSEEHSLVLECDSLVVTGQALADKFSFQGLNPVLIRNGADFSFFSGVQPAGLLSTIRRPIVGYFGAIADWIDLDLIRETAILRPEYSFVLVGQIFRTEVAGLDKLPNVHFMGNQEYGRIPHFLAEFDACTIPFLINQVTNATDPVKLYEYFSQGKPVVATNMPELAQCGDLIYTAASADGFAACLDTAVAERDPSLVERRIAFSRRNTWTERVNTMDRAIQSTFPLVSILIVTFNSAEFAAHCLDSILRFTAWPTWEAIIVDNASTDGTVEILQQYTAKDARFRVHSLRENSGFAAGNNFAAREARGAYLIFLNIDTMVTRGWVGRLVEHSRRKPAAGEQPVGIVCPVTNFAGNEVKITVDYTNAREMHCFAAALAAREHGKLMDIAVAPLYCALVPRSVWSEVGELDAGFGRGMYEDDDYSLRVTRAGYRVVAAEDCFIHHFGQGSFAKMPSQEYNEIFESNRKRFEEKWQISWQPHRTRPGVRPAFGERNFVPSEFCGESTS